MSLPSREPRISAAAQPEPYRFGWLAIGLAALLPLPWAGIWLLGNDITPTWTSLLTGLAILGAAFLLSWAAEAFQLDVSQALALGLLALIAVLPEYAVDAAFAWQAARDPAYAPYAIANMTGANRLLIGIGWSAVVFVSWLRQGARVVRLGSGSALELTVLLAATFYSLIIPLKGSLSLLDTVVLGLLFGLYIWTTSRASVEEPHLVGPAQALGRLSVWRRRTAVAALFACSAGAIFISAEAFAHGLVETGMAMGIDEFLLVQWLAPLASEAPEFIVAVLFAWRLQASAGLRTLISSKVNQWTLLIATLPVVYSLGRGELSALPLDGRQVQELFLTTAQSLFAAVLLAKLDLSRREALLLAALFLFQLAVPTEEVRWGVSGAYLLLVALALLRSRPIRQGLSRLPGQASLLWRQAQPTQNGLPKAGPL